MFRIARSKLIQTTSSIMSVITIYLSVHVRWLARPAEHRAGLEFSLLLSLLQGKESKMIQYSMISILRKSIGWLFDCSEI
jgi:hypothetical protein